MLSSAALPLCRPASLLHKIVPVYWPCSEARWWTGLRYSTFSSTLLLNLYEPGCCPTWDPCGEQGVPCRLCNCSSEQQEELEGIDLIEEQRRNGTEERGGTGVNITGGETNTTGVGKGIFARMNLDFLFGEGDEVTTEKEGEDQIEEEAEEEGIDDGSTCCPAPSNPCEVRLLSKSLICL